MFGDEIGIVAGTKQATTDEQQHAINDLFDIILACRFGNRIHGVFMEYALETRIRNLEEGLEKVNHLVEEIVEWLMKGDK
jgi:hypothetical protein